MDYSDKYLKNLMTAIFFGGLSKEIDNEIREKNEEIIAKKEIFKK